MPLMATHLVRKLARFSRATAQPWGAGASLRRYGADGLSLAWGSSALASPPAAGSLTAVSMREGHSVMRGVPGMPTHVGRLLSSTPGVATHARHHAGRRSQLLSRATPRTCSWYDGEGVHHQELRGAEWQGERTAVEHPGQCLQRERGPHSWEHGVGAGAAPWLTAVGCARLLLLLLLCVLP